MLLIYILPCVIATTTKTTQTTLGKDGCFLYANINKILSFIGNGEKTKIKRKEGPEIEFVFLWLL